MTQMYSLAAGSDSLELSIGPHRPFPYRFPEEWELAGVLKWDEVDEAGNFVIKRKCLLVLYLEMFLMITIPICIIPIGFCLLVELDKQKWRNGEV